jgi:two-component system chemotaxis response regulator CheY
MSRVLVVDDYCLHGELMEQRFRTAGFDVSYAKDVEEALYMLRRDNPDVAVLDLIMPGVGGVGLLKEIRNRPEWKDLPVVVVTADGHGTLIEEAYQLGISRCLVKGNYRFSDLLRLVNRLITDREKCSTGE